MRKPRTTATLAAAIGVALLGGVAAVQQQVPPSLDVDSLADQLGLSAEVKESIAPDIQELNTLLARQEQIRQEHQTLWTRLQEVQGSIAEALTPEQRRDFAAALRQTRGPGYGMGGYGMGPGAGVMGGSHMRAGHMGGGHMGWGGMGMGRMGPGSMGAHMGPGFMGSGAHMGPGWMFQGNPGPGSGAQGGSPGAGGGR